MKVLSLDFGNVRIGIAIGDTEIGVASARPFLTNESETISSIVEICEREGVEKILVGLPKGFSGETKQTSTTRDFAKELDTKVSAKIELIDERFTSKIAEQNLREAEKNSRQQKELIDSESARVLLQEWLDNYPE